MKYIEMSKTELVQILVDKMDLATLWRWKTAIDRRLKRDSET